MSEFGFTEREEERAYAQFRLQLTGNAVGVAIHRDEAALGWTVLVERVRSGKPIVPPRFHARRPHVTWAI